MTTTILLVDDDNAFSQMITTYLSWHDMHVDIETDYTKAISRLNQTRYDLVILDVLTLSEHARNRFSFIKQMRSVTDVEWQNIPIIILSSDHLDATHLKWLRQLNGYYLNKYENSEKWTENIHAILAIKNHQLSTMTEDKQ